jgi:long-subunit acyl-CoA synthetase (AMP-forming)
VGLNLGFVLFVCMQVRQLNSVVQPTAGDFVLSLLPPWHMYERSAEYFILSHGVTQVYTNIKHMKEDLVKYPPDYFIAVPLVFDTLYNGVQKQLAAASTTRRILAQTLLTISLAYMDFRRKQQVSNFFLSTVGPSTYIQSVNNVRFKVRITRNKGKRNQNHVHVERDFYA